MIKKIRDLFKVKLLTIRIIGRAPSKSLKEKILEKAS